MADLQTITITWMDGLVATYKDATHAIRDGTLYIYTSSSGVPVLRWRFPLSSIRAIGDTPWQPDGIPDPP